MLVYQRVNCAWQSQSLVNFLQHLATFGVLKEPEKSHLVMVPLWTQKQLVKVVKGHSSPKYGAINSKILGKWMFMMFIYPKMVGIDGIDRSPSPLITVDHDVITKSLQLHRHLGRSIWLVTSCHPKYSRHFNVFQLDQRIDFPEAHSMFSILEVVGRWLSTPFFLEFGFVSPLVRPNDLMTSCWSWMRTWGPKFRITTTSQCHSMRHRCWNGIPFIPPPMAMFQWEKFLDLLEVGYSKSLFSDKAIYEIVVNSG